MAICEPIASITETWELVLSSLQLVTSTANRGRVVGTYHFKVTVSINAPRPSLVIVEQSYHLDSSHRP